jgi:hypothetical protein
LVDDADIDAEIDTMLESYEPEQKETMKALLREQLVASVANAALDKKIRARIIELVAQTDGAADAAPAKKSAKQSAGTEGAEGAAKKKSTKKAD